MNGEFQRAMQAILSKFGHFQSGNIKLYERCVIKGQIDYALKDYPSMANISDFLRCSVSCKSPDLVIAAMNALKTTTLLNLDSKVTKIEVARIKNGFLKIGTSWKDYKDANYVDLKINVVFTDSTGAAMICEVQLLLDFLLQAKKMGHKCL